MVIYFFIVIEKMIVRLLDFIVIFEWVVDFFWRIINIVIKMVLFNLIGIVVENWKLILKSKVKVLE